MRTDGSHRIGDHRGLAAYTQFIIVCRDDGIAIVARIVDSVARRNVHIFQPRTTYESTV